MSLQLPPAPSSDNPWAFYLNVLTVHYHPSPGFKARIVVLSCSCASIPCSAAIVFSLHCLALRRRGERLWLFKRVKREAGNFIVGSRLPLLCLAALIVAGTLGGAVYTGVRFTRDYTYGVRTFNACMYSFWATFFCFTWMFSCSNAQTYILCANDRRFSVRARTANVIFLGGLLLGVVVLLPLCIYGAVVTNRYMTRGGELFSFLAVQAQEYAGAPVDPSTGAELDRLLKAFSSSALLYYQTSHRLLCIFAVSPCPSLIANLSSLLLWALIRTQRREQADLTSGGLSYSGTDARSKSLKSIEQGFLVDAISLSIWSVGIIVTTAYASIVFERLAKNTEPNWSALETILFCTTWSAAVPVALALLAQAFISFRNLPVAVGLREGSSVGVVVRGEERSKYAVGISAGREGEKEQKSEEEEGESEGRVAMIELGEHGRDDVT